MEYNIKTLQADDGSNVFAYCQNDKQIPLNSLYSPEKEIDRFLKKLHDIQNHLIIFIGFGNGTLLEKIINSRVYEEAAHILFIEPIKEIPISEKFIHLIRENDKVSFFYAHEFTSLTFATYLSKFISLPIKIEVHPNYQKIESSVIKDCLQRLREGISTREVLNNTEMKFAIDWIVEPLLNLKNIDRSIHIRDLKNKFAGEKAVLIAAGPSMKQNLSLIRELQSSAYLFAVGSALRVLLTNGISPDFVMSIDSSDTNYQAHFQDLNYEGTLIFETKSNSKIQNNHKGNLVVCGAVNDYVSSLFYPDLIKFPTTSPSVAIFGLQVITYLGFSEVYLIGQDLALVDGKYYAEGVKEYEAVKHIKADCWVENNQGQLVETTKGLKIFLESFETLIKFLPDIKVFNLSEFGAKINGTQFLHPSKIQSMPDRKPISISNFSAFNLKLNDSDIKTHFIEELKTLSMDVKKASDFVKKLHKIGSISPREMKKVLKMFRKVSNHEILHKVILANLTFIFNNLSNKFQYFETKDRYSNHDLLILTKELNHFYILVDKYIADILNDKRISYLTK